ncbi:uncharacterized protein CC84DRAFT_1114836 [Paraphaeosphaeria sporulosa]|uniref:SAP domain-containing protein n=1 Tax=Paraphaeosphaeria sporulosa TaxID=1460663 RepID=A0A177CLG6_9PLEO|nr:uncharacterized protein CC84DRAFT_1114836 [Paraphaeosphaeria sporulosa]OAG08394.1 hypothetical protein CC84DRAFT_1114836 [Paraphaeosphaeria sporulosa]
MLDLSGRYTVDLPLTLFCFCQLRVYPATTINTSKIKDDDIGGDNHSVASFSDDAALDEDIGVAHYDEIHLSDPMTFDEDLNFQDLGDYVRDSSPVRLQGYDDYIGANAANDDLYADDGARSAKRSKTTLAVRSKNTQPAHYRHTTLAAERSAQRVTADDSVNYHIEDDVGIAYTGPSRLAGTFGKINREKGSTLPAYHKKVSHELDSDDELMMVMREKGFSDKQIADRLLKAKRVKYDSKSVSTRIQRIKVVQAQRADFELENGIIEWKMEDDHLLLRAYDIASIEIAYEIERLRAWRFKKTAEWMRRMNKTSLFSGKACHARYAALLDGTATIPCDVDDDPAARHTAMAAFRAEKEAERDAEREAQEAAAAEQERIKLEAAERQAALNLEKAKKQAAKKKASNARATQQATKKALEARQAEEYLRKKEAAAQEKAKKKADAEKNFKLRQDFALRHFRNVTEETPDPRRVLSIADLRMLCRARKMNDYVGRKEGDAKAVLLKRLQDADEALRATKLREMVREKGIPSGGNKVQMLYQLALFAARECDSYVANREGEEVDGGDESEGMEVDGMV